MAFLVLHNKKISGGGNSVTSLIHAGRDFQTVYDSGQMRPEATEGRQGWRQQSSSTSPVPVGEDRDCGRGRLTRIQNDGPKPDPSLLDARALLAPEPRIRKDVCARDLTQTKDSGFWRTSESSRYREF